MVCRECGAYNAEHLTHCRVCAAKLRDTDEPIGAEDTNVEEQADRPSRDFAKAPSWPARAYSGAAENPPLTKDEPEKKARPAARAAAETASAPALEKKAFCPGCGKPAIEGAAFCPYCGTKITLEAAAPVARPAAAKPAAPVKPAPVEKPVKKAAKRPVKDDFDEDDYDDEDDFDDEEFDEPPKKKAGKKSFLPAKAAPKPAKKDEYDDEDEDEDDEFDDDDEDEFDDDDEFDDMPKKSKGTTLLFWGLIVLLVALIAVFGVYIVKKNFDGDASKMFASIGSIFGKKPDDAATGGDASGEPVQVAENNMNTASISEYTDENGELWYDISIYAPTGSSVSIVTDAQLEKGPVNITQNDHLILRVAKDVFMPNAPCESEIVTITPNIQVVTPEGETVQLKVDDITVTVPKLNLTLDSPESETIQQTFSNDPIVISGSVDNSDIREIYVNDTAYPVYEGGVFTLTYTPKMAAPAPAATPTAAPTTTAAPKKTDDAATDDDAADDATADDTAADDTAGDAAEPVDTAPAAGAAGAGGTETITIEARMNNYVTARKVITIEPYVVQNMTLTVTNDPATGLRADDGKVTLTGTVTPGATLKASCDEAAALTFGEPSVASNGAFTVAVSITEIGAYDVELTATQTGYNDTTVSAIVERPPTDKYSTYLKKCKDLSKSYDDIVAGTVSTGAFYATGKVTEIIGTTPYTVFKIELSDGKSVVCVNRSSKSTINDGDLKEKKQVIGSLKGLYTDGATPYLWGWFSLNKG